MIFDNVGDAVSRLQDTLVMYDGKATLVTGVDDGLRIHGVGVLSEEQVVFTQDDPLYSSVCPSLGYINTPDNTFYFMRQPLRRWKQGIDTRALVCPTEGIRARGILSHTLIANCLEGRYPSLPEALGLFESVNPFKSDRRRGVAFSKHFAVVDGGQGFTLHYKGSEVGVVENGQPILSAKNFWLNELLESEL